MDASLSTLTNCEYVKASFIYVQVYIMLCQETGVDVFDVTICPRYWKFSRPDVVLLKLRKLHGF